MVIKQRKQYSKIWPIDHQCSGVPRSWCGWPDNKKFAVALIHDVETLRGHDRVEALMNLEIQMGFRSCFNFVPERYFPQRYSISPVLRQTLKKNGFDVGVHGLRHDGKLFSSMEKFKKYAVKINHYLKNWESVGFSSPSMHHNLSWMYELDIEYDTSTFDTDPFEPQPDGVSTIYPFEAWSDTLKKSYMELPYNLPQDFTLFIIMRERTIDIWKKKLDWIAENGGMVLLNSHPDYMQFNSGKERFDEYPVSLYQEFLQYIVEKYNGRYWQALPREIAEYCKKNAVPRICTDAGRETPIKSMDRKF